MKTSDLTGAHLDYWTARAEGVPADQLEIRNAQRPDDPRAPKQFCVRIGYPINTRDMRIDYSTNWALTGPLLEKYTMILDRPEWRAEALYADKWGIGDGDTPLIAICRAVVRAAFGDEVEDLP